MRSPLITLFGVIPAFFLFFILVPVAFASLVAFGESSELADLQGVVVFFTGLSGFLALAFTDRSKTGPIGMVGLLLGIWTVFQVDLHAHAPLVWKLFIFSPVVVATFLMLEGLYGLIGAEQEDDENPF